MKIMIVAGGFAISLLGGQRLAASEARDTAVVASSVSSSARTVGAEHASASVPPEALARATRKLDTAVGIVARFDEAARQQGLSPSWRYGMIANLMKADEANFAAVAYAPDLDRARLAAQDLATMPQREPVDRTPSRAAAPAATGMGSSSFGSVSKNLVYVPISPCRILDTRAGTILTAHTAHDFYFDAGNVGSAPCSVSSSNSSGAFPAALAINATVVAATFPGPSAFLAIYPQGSAKSSSFLNYTSGQTIANAGLITINQASGLFTVFNQESTHLVVDVFGIFTAPGGGTSATGVYATALGQGTIASGDNSTALGYFTIAAGSDSTAMGHLSSTPGGAPFSTAMGYAAQTGAPAAMSLGNHTQANGDSSVALGYYTVASAARATAMGDATLASQNGATAMGVGTQATAGASTAMGSGSIASGAYSTAMGATTKAQGAASVATGQQTVASGDYSTAMGYSNTASGYVSTAIGYSNTASGNSSFAAGQYTDAAGVASVALGNHVSAVGDNAFVFNGKPDTPLDAGYLPGLFIVSVPYLVRFIQAGQYCSLSSSSGGWDCSSDRNLKTAVEPIDVRGVLAKVVAMPVSSWEWKDHASQGVRHLGPMAQDFKAAFELGGDDKSIGSTDAQGVALAAIKGLYEELKDRDARLEAQDRKIEALRQQLERQLRAGPSSALPSQ